MTSRFYYFIISLFIILPGFSQVHFFEQKTNTQIFSAADSAFSATLPVLSVPDIYKSIELPPVHDNSTSPYLRPVFNQFGGCCGQASSVGYNFTYEMNRKRGLPANDSSNQYPTHFTWNFMNGGEGWFGVNYMHSFEIIKTLGTPSVADYGGMDPGDKITWVSGYDMYYNGMHNRIRNVNRILVKDEEGLLTLKHWLHNHLEGSEEGGIASFYATNPWDFELLPDDSPEAGKSVIISIPGESASHSMTIVGYNDNIQFDVNEDGQYTNHIDINNDDVVNMKDWEIGGVKIVNSYGESWKDSGFCYMMYKTLAENMGEGGIWNHSTHVLDVKENYQPLLSYKFTIKHDSREKIKISAGVTTDTSYMRPDHIITFPVFDYQGSNHYMQGGRVEEYKKYLEAGLDITPLLSYVDPGEPARFFIMINENDPEQEGTGRLIDFTLMDYTNALVEIPAEQNDVHLVENGMTYNSMVHTPVFEQAEIITEELPAASGGGTYQAQIEAQNGTEPYSWEILTPYHQQQTNFNMPEINDEGLYPNLPVEQFAIQKIGFDFPFYGETFDTLYIHKNGFIMFEDDLYPWPYFNDPYLLFKNVKNISAFMFSPVEYYRDPLTDNTEMWYEGNEDYAAFRWNGPLFYFENEIGEGEFAVILYPDGNVDFFFNGIEMTEDVVWYAGVSKGNDIDYTLLKNAHTIPLPEVSSYRLIPETPPKNLVLDQNGLLTGSPEISENITNITIAVADDNLLSTNKTFQFSDGLIFEYTIHSGADDIVQNGETISIDLTVKNTFNETFHNLSTTFISDDPLLSILNATAGFGDILPGESLTIEEAISLQVSESCPNNYTFISLLELSSDEADWNGRMTFEAHTINLEITAFNIQDDNNNILDPGETSHLNINLSNSSLVQASDVYITLSTNNDYISIDEPTQHFDVISKGDTKIMMYSVSADENTPIGHEVEFNIHVEFDPDFTTSFTQIISIGQFTALVFNKASTTTSIDAITESMMSVGLEPITTQTLPEDLSVYRSVFVCLGTFYTSHSLTDQEGSRLANYLDTGGNVYMEGTMTWSINEQTAVHNYFNLETETVEYPEFIQLTGISGTFSEDMNFVFSDEHNNLPCVMYPVAPGFALFNADEDEEQCIVTANPTNTYRTIAAIHEFGSMGNESNIQERKDYMYQILSFFRLGDYITTIPEASDISTTDISMNIFPNPFKSQANLVLDLVKETLVEVEIFDLSGQAAYQWIQPQKLSPGKHHFLWNGENERGKLLPPGIYIFQLKAGNTTQTGKIIRLE